jgi:hypothetical protein
MVLLKLFRVFKPAGSTVCVFFFLSFVHFVRSPGISVEVFVLMRAHCRIEAQPGALSRGDRCHFCSTRYFRTANSTSLISISHHLAPFDELSWPERARER